MNDHQLNENEMAYLAGAFFAAGSDTVSCSCIRVIYIQMDWNFRPRPLSL